MKKILILLILLLTGCSYMEISKTSFVTIMGIDYIDEYKVTILTIDYSSSSKSSIYTKTGSNISYIMDEISKNTKTISLSHLNVVFISDNVDFKDISDYFIKKSNKNFYIAYTDDSFELLNNLNEKEDYNTYITNEVKNNDNTLYKILDEECYFLPYLDSNLNNNGEIFYCQKYINVDDNISKINKLLNDNKINLNIKCNNDYVNIDVKKTMNKLNVYINENKCLNSTKIIKNQISLMLDEYNDFVNKYNLNKKISNYKINIMINEGGNNE